MAFSFSSVTLCVATTVIGLLWAPGQPRGYPHDVTHVVHFPYTDELLPVKASITSLASGTGTGDLEVYFEAICDDKVEILSPLILGGGEGRGGAERAYSRW